MPEQPKRKLNPRELLAKYHPADQARARRIYGERPADDAGRVGQRKDVDGEKRKGQER